MTRRYGIHTMEFFYRLSRKWFDKVADRLKQAKHGKYYKDLTYHSDAGITKYTSTAFSKYGVVIYLYRQDQSKNKTNKNLTCWITLRLNPLTLIEQHYQPKGVFQAEEYQLIALEDCMNDLLRNLGLDVTFEKLTLTRIDCCLDFFPNQQEWVDEALRVMRRSKVMKAYKESRFPADDPRHKEKNKHSWRIYCKTATITAYDKTFQLLEEDLIEKHDAPMLRIEVARSSAKFKRGLSDKVKGSNQEIIHTVMEASRLTIHEYLEDLHADEEFVKYDECLQRIREVKSKKTREHMCKLVKKLSDCKSYAKAVENSKLSKKQLRTAEEEFQKLGISPITIRNKAPFESLRIAESDE